LAVFEFYAFRVDWLKNQWAQARSGDSVARRKLLIASVFTVIALSLLISGQIQSQPVAVRPQSKIGASSFSSSGFVHLSGAVKTPGVYPIRPGMRLFEVLALAGGFSPKADRDSVNLARTVTDGEQITVSVSGGASVSDGLIHLNRASAGELDKLPGIGPTLAGRIIDWRNANQGFKSVEDLRKVGGIGDKLFAGLKSLVTL
jgi:competence protein ComEA